MLMNETADELPIKFISFVGKAGHRRNHNEVILCVAQNCSKM